MFNKKVILSTLLSLMILVGGFSADVMNAEAANYEIGAIRVTNTDTYLYSEPDCQSAPVVTLPKGSVFTVVRNEPVYTFVDFNGAQGYIYQEFIYYDEVYIAAYMAELLARSEEIRTMAAMIQCEAGSEPYEGQVAVGQVIMNRVKSEGYPNTIWEVMMQPGQFTPASGDRYYRILENDTIKDSCRQAAIEAYQGGGSVGACTRFRRNDGREGIVIGHHVFW